MYKRFATQEDIDVIKNDMMWPWWPYLPMKRHHPETGQQLGSLQLKSSNGYTIILCNMFEMVQQADKSKYETLTYPDLDSMLNDGWYVD